MPQDNITIEEIKKSINRLKNGKAAGDDCIIAEMVKNMGSTGGQAMLETCRKAWRKLYQTTGKLLL